MHVTVTTAVQIRGTGPSTTTITIDNKAPFPDDYNVRDVAEILFEAAIKLIEQDGQMDAESVFDGVLDRRD